MGLGRKKGADDGAAYESLKKIEDVVSPFRRQDGKVITFNDTIESVQTLVRRYQHLENDCDQLATRANALDESLRMVRDRMSQAEAEVARLNKQHEEQRRNTEAFVRELLSQTKADLQQTEQNLKRKVRDQLKQLQEAQEAAVAEEHSLHIEQLRQQADRHESEISAFTSTQERLRLQYKHKEQQQKEHTENLTRQHQKELQSRNRALLARETVVALSDSQIRDELFQLSSDVEEFAREKWKFNRSPWTDDIQRQATRTPKRLQKQILVDSIWTVFDEHIFCSPFRVLGKEGAIVEEQWQDAFGNGTSLESGRYIWPKPSFEAEQWRYNTMRPCQKILDVVTSDYDHRSKLRIGFEESLRKIQNKLIETFEMVTDLDPNKKKGLYELARKAAKFWILLCTQRCRLLVTMNDMEASIKTARSEAPREHLTEFVLRPEVRRIGDADGENLNEPGVVIKDCQREVETIRYTAMGSTDRRMLVDMDEP